MGKDRDKLSDRRTVEKISIGEEFLANIPVGAQVENTRWLNEGKPFTAKTTQGGIYDNPECDYVTVVEINGNKKWCAMWSIEYVQKVEESSEELNK